VEHGSHAAFYSIFQGMTFNMKQVNKNKWAELKTSTTALTVCTPSDVLCHSTNIPTIKKLIERTCTLKHASHAVISSNARNHQLKIHL
jgi:hypothetical protein